MSKSKGLKTLFDRLDKAEKSDLGDVVFRLPSGVGTRRELIQSLENVIEKLEGLRGPYIPHDVFLDLFEMAMGEAPRSSGTLHPSELANGKSWCARKIYFDIEQVEWDENARPITDGNNQLQRLFDLGTMVHMYIQWNLRQSGHLVESEVVVRDSRLMIDGRADGKLCNIIDGEVLLEVKTINGYGFESVKESPKENHVQQASIYASVLGVEKILVVYYNKNTSDMVTHLVDIDRDFVRDVTEFAQQLKRLKDKNAGKELEDSVLPKMVCRKRTSERALECPYADTCFKLKHLQDA